MIEETPEFGTMPCQANALELPMPSGSHQSPSSPAAEGGLSQTPRYPEASLAHAAGSKRPLLWVDYLPWGSRQTKRASSQPKS